MSLIGRTTEDYSPLRAPIVNPHTGRDIRPQWERQKYEQAVNARREMLSVFDTMPARKMSKNDHRRFKRAGVGHVSRNMLNPAPLSAFTEQ